VGENYKNNWATPDNPSACPPVPGPNDHASISGLVDSQGFQINLAGLTQSGMFLCRAQHLSIVSGGEIATFGTILEPSTFQLLGGSIINLYDGATINIGSFTTFDVRNGVIRLFGEPGQAVINHGTLTKTAEAGFTSWINVPIENHGLIRAEVGLLNFDVGGTSDGVIEAMSGATVFFSGGTFEIEGEVRGDGLIHFQNGTANIACEPGDYHPTNTLIGGYPTVVNFQTDTSVGRHGPVSAYWISVSASPRYGIARPEHAGE
jgi:hypothetical protein